MKQCYKHIAQKLDHQQLEVVKKQLPIKILQVKSYGVCLLLVHLLTTEIQQLVLLLQYQQLAQIHLGKSRANLQIKVVQLLKQLQQQKDITMAA